MIRAMFGFGTKIRHVFTSRWKAVTWSLGVLLTAYCTVPAADQARQHEDKQVVKEHAAHKSPWSKS
jgi:hypothetical protein